jgi:hypothetical protein
LTNPPRSQYWLPRRNNKEFLMLSRSVPKLVVHIDRGEYFSMTNGWLAQLALLQGVVPPGVKVTDPLIGSWRGGQVEIVVSGLARTEVSPAVTELAALFALQGGSVETVYWRLRQNFADIGRKIGLLIARNPDLWDFCFEAMTTPIVPSWLTTDEAQRLLYGIRNPLGEPFFQKYKDWLASRRGVPDGVKDLLENSGYYADLKRFTQAS